MSEKSKRAEEAQPHAQVRPSVWARHLTLGRVVLTLSVNHPREQDEARGQLTNRVAALRRERGLGREELAERLQIHLSTLLALEKGTYEPGLRLALRVSEFFELPVEAIFFSPTASHLTSAEQTDKEETDART